VIGQDQIDGTATVDLQRFVYTGRGDDRIAGMLKHELAKVQAGFFIING
jgi:hypothetical protein